MLLALLGAAYGYHNATISVLEQSLSDAKSSLKEAQHAREAYSQAVAHTQQALRQQRAQSKQEAQARDQAEQRVQSLEASYHAAQRALQDAQRHQEVELWSHQLVPRRVSSWLRQLSTAAQGGDSEHHGLPQPTPTKAYTAIGASKADP